MGTKRTLDSFVTVNATRRKKSCTQNADVGGLVEQVLPEPAGLSIFETFVTADEEKILLDFLDSQKWRTDLARRCMHYGGSYCIMPPKGCSAEERARIETTTIDAPQMPAELDFVIARMIQFGLYTSSARPAYCIVNEYKPGQGISAHVENFRFGEPVCSLTLAGSDTMRFHELTSAHDGSVRSGRAASAPRTGRRKDVPLPRRSLVVLRGASRSSWQHEIVRGRAASKPIGWRRVSLTFRVDRR